MHCCSTLVYISLSYVIKKDTFFIERYGLHDHNNLWTFLHTSAFKTKTKHSQSVHCFHAKAAVTLATNCKLKAA